MSKTKLKHRFIARPNGKPMSYRQRHPLITALLEKVTEIIDGSEGKITLRKFSEETGIGYTTASQYLGMKRDAPNGEKALAIQAWVAANSGAKKG